MTISAERRSETTRIAPAWPALAALAAATLLASLGISIASVALPTLARAFSVSISEVQWVVLAYLLSVTVMVVVGGRLSDLYGQRRVLLGGLIVFALSSVLCAASTTLPVLVAGRLLQGVGGAVLIVVPMSMAREITGRERMGSAMGLLGSMSAIGTALGPSAGGMLIAAWGWQSTFLALAVLAGPVALASLFALPQTHGTRAANAGAPRTAFLSRIANRRLASGLAMNVLVAVVMISTLSIGPFFLTFALKLDVAAVGMILAVGPIMSAASGVPAGRATDRFTAPTVILAGLAITVFGLVALASLPRLFGIAGYVIALCMLTPGFQLFLAANNTEVMTNAPDDTKGTISGLLSLSRNLGFMLGASVMSAVFSSAAGSGAIDAVSGDAVARAFTVTFIACAGIALLALLLALVFRPVR
jgi:MFS family permease